MSSVPLEAPVEAHEVSVTGRPRGMSEGSYSLPQHFGQKPASHTTCTSPGSRYSLFRTSMNDLTPQ